MKAGMEIKPGDWVRFRSGGALVVGVVAYVFENDSWKAAHWKVMTDVGVTDEVAILEIRRGAK